MRVAIPQNGSRAVVRATAAGPTATMDASGAGALSMSQNAPQRACSEVVRNPLRDSTPYSAHDSRSPVTRGCTSSVVAPLANRVWARRKRSAERSAAESGLSPGSERRARGGQAPPVPCRSPISGRVSRRTPTPRRVPVRPAVPLKSGRYALSAGRKSPEARYDGG